RTSGHGGAGTTGGSTGDVGPPVRARVLPCAASEMGAAVTGLRSVAEAVADSAHRLDVLPGGAELLAEPLHMGVDGARRDVSVHAQTCSRRAARVWTRFLRSNNVTSSRNSRAVRGTSVSFTQILCASRSIPRRPNSTKDVRSGAVD